MANAQLTIVKDVNATGLTPSNPNSLIWQNNKWNGKYYYPVTAYPSVKLAVTDGTSAGTTIVKDLAFTGIASASIDKIIPAQDFFYFYVNVLVGYSPWQYRDELWKSDGTPAGTVLVKRFDPRGMLVEGIQLGSESYDYTNSSLLGNEMYFQGFSTTNGLEMWRTDGTEAGTFMVKDLYTGTTANVKGAQAFARLGSSVYFISNYKLWKTDGTDAGTVMLDVPGLNIYANHRLQTFKNKLYFIGHDATNGMEPWVSDGTVAGTHILRNTSVRTDNVYNFRPYMFNKTDDYLVFDQLNSIDNNNLTLWRTDGTEAGTIPLTPFGAIDSGFGTGATFYHMTNNGMYIHNATSKNIIYTNYQNDGYKNVSHPFGGQVGNLYNYSGTLWFSSGTFYQAGNNDFMEPWRCDGLQVVKTYDLNPLIFNGNNYDSNPFGFFESAGDLFFFANPGGGIKLYKFHGDFTFNNSVDGNWSKGSNWNAGITPLINDVVTIPSGYSSVSADVNAYAKDLGLNSPLNLTSGSLNVSGNVILNSKITLNNSHLNLKGRNYFVEGNPVNYIVNNGTGTVNIENLNSTRGIIDLPIGTSTNYNPISISNTGTSDNFSARVSDTSDFTNGGINATWEIFETTAGGSNVNLTLGWNTAQEQSGFSPTTAKIVHKVSGVWNEENSGTVSGTNPYTITATGITEFSPFSVAVPSLALGTSNISKSKVSVYPNPFNDNLNISTQENGVVYFYDLSGKSVSTSSLMKGSNSLNKSSLEKGIYLYQVKGKDGSTIASGKIIKK